MNRSQFLATFQFSQGDTGVQHDLFQYLRLLCPHLSLPATDGELHSLITAWTPAASAIATNRHRHAQINDLSESGIVWEAISIAHSVLNTNAHEAPHRTELIADLAQRLVQLDLDFLSKPNGRDYVPDGSGHYNPYKDSWRSDVCYFGLLGRTTGISEFDQLFADISKYWRAHWQDSAIPVSSRQSFQDIVAVFNTHHQQQSDLQVSISGLTA